MNISDLSLTEKLGQRFIMGVNNNNVNEIIDLIKNAKIGGVILYKNNYQSYDEMVTLVRKLKKTNINNKIPLFIAIDQEGGKVNRFPIEVNNLININDVSKQDVNLVKDYANIIGKMLMATGINMNLAPVLDIDNGSRAKSLYKRCFFGDNRDVTDCAIKYIDGISSRVISVFKHYPGHGLTKYDSHLVVPYVFNYKKINYHVKPFDEMVNNMDALMVGHIVIRKLTGLLPASISNKFLNKYLRKKYDGLIITDEINMLRRQLFYHFLYLDKALKSASDIILVKVNSAREGYEIINKYHKIISMNNKHLEMLNDSVERIINVKKKYKISDGDNFGELTIQDLNKMILEFNDKINESLHGIKNNI